MKGNKKLANPKYTMNVVVTDSDKKEVMKGFPFLDLLCKKLPASGKFIIEFFHSNPKGFAKLVCILSAIAKLIGVKVITSAKWTDLAVTGKDIPESVSIEFTSKESALCACYVFSIACMVDGNWKNFPEESQAALSIWLGHIQANGIEMFIQTGKFCSGRLLPLKSKDNLPLVIREVMKAKQYIANEAKLAKTAIEVKPEVKKPTSRKTKPEVKPEVKKDTLKVESKPEVKPEVKPTVNSEVFEAALEASNEAERIANKTKNN